MTTATSVLQSSLETHNATFETLLNLIPARYYLVQDLSEEQVRQVYIHWDINRGTQISREDSLQVPKEQQEAKGT